MRAVEGGIADLASYGIRTRIFAIGKRGQRHLARKRYDVELAPPDASGEALVEWAARRVAERFQAGESSGCNLAFNRFVNAARQELTFWNLLPVSHQGEVSERHLEYLYEPEREQALAALCQELLRSSIRQALLESNAAEQAARMAAMDAATKNADDMITHLTSVYNRERQEAITTELMDIVGGAEALR